MLKREPQPGRDRVQIEVTTENPVFRPGKSRFPLQTGDVVLWTDHMIHLHQAGDIRPTCLEVDIKPPQEQPPQPRQAEDTPQEPPQEAQPAQGGE